MVALGGPLMLQHDGSLVGVASFVEVKRFAFLHRNPIRLQVFVNIQYYYDWISGVTGLEMPQCEHPVEPTGPVQIEAPPTVDQKQPDIFSWFKKFFQ